VIAGRLSSGARAGALALAFLVGGATRAARAGEGGILQPGGTEIAGLVEDATSRPIEGADVIITRPDGSGRQSAITDFTGAFALGVFDPGPLQVLVITGRGARATTLALQPTPGTRVVLHVCEGAPDAGLDATLTVVGIGQGAARPTVIPVASGADGLGLSRDRDLAGALVRLPGVAPATAPAGGPVVAGLPVAEIPVTFEGFMLNDPVDGAAPVDLPVALFGAATLDRDFAPAIALFAPRPQSGGAHLAVGGAMITGARGADGSARPRGATSAWSAEAGAAGQTSGGAARGTLVIAPARAGWDADPESVLAPRGRRRLVVPVLGWGAAEAGGWQISGGGLGNLSATQRGRAARLALPDEPTDSDRSWWLLGATARRQLAPGSNDLALQVGYLRASRSDESAALPAIDQQGSRLTLGAAARVAGRWGVWHALALSMGLDLERANRGGGAPSRQPGAIFSGADAHATLPWVDLSERLVPAPSFQIELAARLGVGAFTGRSGFVGLADQSRSFKSKLAFAPRVRLSWRPFAVGAADLVLFAAGGRRTGVLPLDALMGAAAGPRLELALPAEDALSAGAAWQHRGITLGLRGQAGRSSNIVEDRFSIASGQLELFAPPGAERRFRALIADADVQLTALRFGLSAVLARHEGNHVGFIDEASGRSLPAGTGAFDSPDTEANRSGPLPFDRPYGLRGFVAATVPAAWTGGFAVRGALRGRIDAGTPRAATARSATSGTGQVFLVERGSLGRTSAPTSVDAAVSVERALGGRRLWLALEGFNLTQHRPVVARDPVFTDAVAAGVPGGRGVTGLGQVRDASGAAVAQAPTFARAVAYAEPLLVRLLVGVEF
jgi:hypothetical protein